MRVTVKTPSRIHLGLIDLNGELGRVYGSIGLALDEPSVVVEAKPAESLEIRGEDSERVGAIVKRFSEAYGVMPEAEINVLQTIPEHVGLGSGTQVSLAVASALTHITKLSVSIDDIARSMNRGIMSGVGVEAFRGGGFIIDSGKKVGAEEGIPFAIYRRDFPKDWTFILAVPEGQHGISGTEEESAFQRVMPASPEIARDVCRLLQMKLLPALVEEDIEVFGESLMEIDRKVGLYFSEVQGGAYIDSVVQGIVDKMLESGAHGAGQSSWGPAVYGVVEDNKAQGLEASVRAFFAEKGIAGPIIRAHANNHGAEVSIVEE